MVPFPVVLAVVAVCITLYYYYVKKLNYFKELGVPHVPPKPLVGNIGGLISKQSTLLDILKEAYNVDREAKYVGHYEFLTPILMIRDPELIKTICVKNFDHFLDHQGFSNAQADPLLHGMLFNLKGDKWREERSMLSPTFTSSKIKNMFKLMTNVAVRYTNHAARMPEKGRELEMKSFMTRYTNDVIATCVYGVIVDSIKEPRNQYYVYGLKVSTFTGFINSMKFLMLRHLPKIAGAFGLRMVPTYVDKFFTEELNNTVKERQKRGTWQPDMVQLLLDASKKKNMSMDQMNAHSFGFYFGGFDSIASQTSIVLHMITEHQHVQKRLQDEIDEALEKNNGDLSYDTIYGLKYLDAVINETLRIYPIAYFLDRVCTKPYELPPATSGGKTLSIKPGTILWIPVGAIHTDPQYYENPDTFDPDRFLDSRKRILNSASYMPFGVGPRACIGNRFALAEMKAFICHLMARCDLKPSKKTVIPFSPEKGVLNVAPKGGFWLKVEPRKNPHPSLLEHASMNGTANGVCRN